MTAENVFAIVLHLPEKELGKLYALISKRLDTGINSKTKKQKLITDKEAIDYLIKNVFSKVV